MKAAKEYVDSQVREMKSLWRNKRQLAFQFFNLAMVVLSALMIWKGLMLTTQSESPVVVVLSGSMEPAFQRGDILFLSNRDSVPFTVGEIVVFKVRGREIPIVHRILTVHEDTEGDLKMLTKGDNNGVDDRALYATNQVWLEREEVMGRARGAMPYIGMLTILLNDYPWLKYVLVGGMGIFVLTSKDGA